MKQDVVTARQLNRMSLFSVVSILAGTAPAIAARTAGSAGWLSPLFGALPVLAVVFLLQYMFRRCPARALDQIFYAVWGAVPGRVILSLYVLWCVLQASFSLRLYVEHIHAGMFAQAGGAFFALMMLAVCYWASRGRLAVLVRAAAVLFGLVALVLLAILLLALPDYRVENLLPVNPLKAPSIAMSGAAVLGPFGVMVYAQFLSGRVSDRHQLGRSGVMPLTLAALGGVLLFVFTIGILGAPLTAVMQNPFLIAAKNISGIEGNARLDAFVTALWTMPTFVFISLMGMTALTLTGSVCKLDDAKNLAGPLQLLIYVGAMSLGAAAADVMAVGESYVQYGHYVFLVGIPLLTLGLGKLRREF